MAKLNIQIGDVITWDLNCPEFQRRWIEEFGPGPFLVVGLHDGNQDLFDCEPIGYRAQDSKWQRNFSPYEKRSYFYFDNDGFRKDEFLTAVKRAKYG